MARCTGNKQRVVMGVRRLRGQTSRQAIYHITLIWLGASATADVDQKQPYVPLNASVSFLFVRPSTIASQGFKSSR